MDKKSFSFFALGLLVGCLLTAIAMVPSIRSSRMGVDGSRTLLRLAHALEPSHPVHLGMEHMAERVAELSGGLVEIQIFPGGQLGSEPECIEQVQRGALAMVKTSTAAMEGFVPDMAVFGLPYLFRDDIHYWNVLNGEIGRDLLTSGEPHNIHGLCYYDSGSRSFYTLNRPVLSPSDVRELRIRVLPSKMARDMISIMGGGATPIPWGELYTALQQGMVDGAENNPPSFLSSRHYEVAKHFSLDEHTRIPDMVIFSKSIWDGLSAQEKAWVQQAAEESVTFQRKLWQEYTETALEEVQAAGVKVYRPDKQPFMDITAPMFDEFAGTRVGELAEAIRAVE